MCHQISHPASVRHAIWFHGTEATFTSFPTIGSLGDFLNYRYVPEFSGRWLLLDVAYTCLRSSVLILIQSILIFWSYTNTNILIFVSQEGSNGYESITRNIGPDQGPFTRESFALAGTLSIVISGEVNSIGLRGSNNVGTQADRAQQYARTAGYARVGSSGFWWRDIGKVQWVVNGIDYNISAK